MIYSMQVSEECEKNIEKLYKKNPVLREALENKIGGIKNNIL